MTKYQWMLIFFWFSFVITLIGVWQKITHPENNSFLTAGIILSFLSYLLAIYEVVTSKRIETPRKVLWVVLIVLLGWIGIVIYLLTGRKDIVQQNDIRLQN